VAVLLEEDFQRQNSRQPCRCQRTTVSGVTKERCARQLTHHRRARTQSTLSHVRSRARRRVRVGRASTPSWWRSRTFSRTRSWRGRTQARTVTSSSQTSSSTSSASPIYTRAGFCRLKRRWVRSSARSVHTGRQLGDAKRGAAQRVIRWTHRRLPCWCGARQTRCRVWVPRTRPCCSTCS
jgi:hypothetical protein